MGNLHYICAKRMENEQVKVKRNSRERWGAIEKQENIDRMTYIYTAIHQKYYFTIFI